MTHESCCNRRTFLRGAGLTLAGVGLTTLLPPAFVEYAAAAGTTGRRLLFLYMGGGCDVLNTVIPHGDPDYSATNRPTLYIPPASAIALNGFASLHPSLQDMMDVYNAGDLAIVHRVGYPAMTLSHFDGYKIWNGGDPAHKQIGDGWLYRYIVNNALQAGVPLPVVTVNGTTPQLVLGPQSFVNVANPDNFDYIMAGPVREKFRGSWREWFTALGGLETFRPVLADTGLKLADVTSEYASWDQANWNPRDPNTGWSLFPVDDATNPTLPGNVKKFTTDSYGFFKNLKICALALLESDGSPVNGTRVAGMEMGGFDTHDGQGALTGPHPNLLSWVAYGMKSLRIVLSGAALDPRNYASIWDDTAVITFSEFGRTSRENGSLGTDHGQATFSLVAGGRVNGGVYNCDASTWDPGSMFAVDGFYLSHRTDYRALYWEILRDHMGANPATVDAIFPGYTAAGLTELNLFL